MNAPQAGRASSRAGQVPVLLLTGPAGAGKNVVATALALNFVAADFTVVILDVISEEVAQAYARGLTGIPYRCVRLLPSFDEVRRRNALRGMRITEQEIAMLYAQQARLTACNCTIDNTHLEANEVATMLAGLMLEGTAGPPG